MKINNQIIKFDYGYKSLSKLLLVFALCLATIR